MSDDFYKWGAVAVSYEGARMAHTSFLRAKYSGSVSRTTGRVIVRSRLPSTGKIIASVGRGSFQIGSATAKLGVKHAPAAGRFLGSGARFTGVAVRSPASTAILTGLKKFILPVSIALGIRGAFRGIETDKRPDSVWDAAKGPLVGAARGFFLWE